jgi:lysophospholipase L1-like esterase
VSTDLAYVVMDLDSMTGADRPPVSRYATLELDPHMDVPRPPVLHVKAIVVILDAHGHAATANGVTCVPAPGDPDGLPAVPVVAGVAYAVSAPGVLRETGQIPALTAGQVVNLSSVIVPGAPLTPDQAAALAARVTALEATPPGSGVTDHGALTGLADDDHPNYLTTGRGDARYVQGTDSRLTDARTPTAHEHTLADVTDAGTAAAADVGDFATAAQGILADAAEPAYLYRFPTLDLMDKSHATGVNIGPSKDELVMRVFRAPADVVATGVTLVTGTTPGSGQTETRVFLMHLGDASTNPTAKRTVFWPIARSDSDTTLFTVANTVYTKSFSAVGGWPTRVRLRRGEWYAAGYFVNGGTAPQFTGVAASWTIVNVGMWSTANSASGLGTPNSGLFGSIYGGDMSASYLEPWVQLALDVPAADAAPIPTVALGDSFMGSYNGWIGWGNAQAGSRLVILNNTGDGGNQQLTDMLAKIAVNVTPYAPACVILHGGVNDIGNGASAATIQDRYTAVFDALDAIGVEDIVACVPPPSASFSAGQKTILSTVRAWLLALNRPGVTVVDTGMAMSTGDGVTPDGAKSADGIHPNAVGRQAMADVLDGALAAL